MHCVAVQCCLVSFCRTLRSPSLASKIDLDLARWMLAWDSYALAAVVVEQMDFMPAMQHKHIVMEIASNALGEGYGPQLGVIYDRIAR